METTMIGIESLASSTSLARRSFLCAAAAALAAGILGIPAAVAGENGNGNQKWVASWAASAHGLYPSGTAVAQPDLSFAFPSADTGANDQTFRLIVRPNLWGDRFRIRFSNFFGTKPVTFDDIFIGVQASAGAIVPGTNHRVTFGGARSVTIPATKSLFSDAVELEFIDDVEKFSIEGRKLAVSFHVVGTSGPMTWHSKGMQTSYVTNPTAGSHGSDEGDAAFPNSTTSWYFLDAVDVMAPADTFVVATFGDSITDGTASTLNGDDRWPDVLFRRLRAAYGNRVSLVNEGIGGNRVVSDAGAGGPSALSRLDRDVFSLSGIGAVVWLEGINDLSAGTSAQGVIDGIKEGARVIRDPKTGHGLKLIQATITSALGNNTANAAADADRNERRKVVNAFIRSAGIFDSVADFDGVTVDPSSGQMRAEFLHNSTTNAVDHLHPNRAGYLKMGGEVDIKVLAPASQKRSDRP
jgi:lysophospholipase L1-like esterase